MRPERPLVRLTPRVSGKHWQYYVVAPLVLIVFGPFVLAYKLFFGWWLNPLLDKHYETKLREQVRIDFAFLFQDLAGRFVANGRTHKNVIQVTIEAEDLRIEVSQHHGDYGISVARRENPESAESLDSILEVIYKQEGSPRKPSYINLAELGELFRQKFKRVQLALSREHYSDTVAAIDRSHQLGMQKMAQAFNRPDSYFEADIVSPNDLMKKRSE
jgi:hypothetical protein